MCTLSPIFKQFLTIVICNLLTFSSGNASGWTTINFVELQSEKSTFPAGPLKLKEASLVISIVSLGACAGNFVALPIIHRFGIKRTIHICGVPIILSTLLIIWAKNVYYLYVSRLLCGLSIGILVVALPSMVMAVSDDKVRGSLNALFDLFSNTGVILSFSLGNYLSWMDQAKVQLIPPTIAIIILFFLPESPEYWIKRNKEKRAIKAHKFYKGSIVALEQAEYLQKLNEENVERENDNEIKSNPKLCLRDFLTPQAKRAYFIAFTGFVLNYCSGTILILSYVTDIFTKTGSSLSPKQSSILISVTQITTNIIFVNLVDRFNRRTLLICSSILATITFFVYAAYCLLWMNQSEYQWISSIPTVCFVLIIFFS
ncbi:facilitated trehalose transporter Tret1-like, partial [Sitodiplosis mosellana]|uniref:facilitated trehalose transporter Tret1-like n=1 Tax=Sitodiplosis mosellana TaxID=263140 RepID=UPI002443A56C